MQPGDLFFHNIRVIIFRISSTASSEGEVAGMLTEAAVPHRSWSLSVRQMPPGWAEVQDFQDWGFPDF